MLCFTHKFVTSTILQKKKKKKKKNILKTRYVYLGSKIVFD